MHFKIKKGLEIPINGEPDQTITDANSATEVAVIGTDYVGMKPTMFVQEGDRVKVGQVLFTDKKNPGINYTSPGSGVISAINRGAKRALMSVVIELDDDEHEQFNQYSADQYGSLSAERIRENLINSGLWTAFRTRPYSKIPTIDDVPQAIFINAMDSNPLAGDPAIIIGQHKQDFVNGIRIISKLIDGMVYVCASPDADVDIPDQDDVELAHFSGPHPAGLVGTHIHFLHPVNAERTVWHIGYQDVIAVSKLFATGQLWTDRIVALTGPMVKQPRLIKTRMGAKVSQLVGNELQEGKVRLISGSILNGQRAADAVGFLRRYDNQITVLPQDMTRDLFGWLSPGPKKYSAFNVFLSALNRGKTHDFGTLQNGSPRAMVPLGHYENVMPMDILPTQMLRALVVGDTDSAQALGCLEMDEEDLALCSFVCPSKNEFGPVLRARLEQIEKEG